MNTEAFEEYLATARWYAGKGRDFSVTAVRRLGEIGTGDEPTVVVDLVEVSYPRADSGTAETNETTETTETTETELYQVPLALYSEPQPRLEHAFVGWWEEPGLGRRHVYDAVHDREAMAAFLAEFAAAPADPAAVAGPLRFVRVSDEIPTEANATLFSGEQSNSTVAFGDDAVLKVFRKVTPGANPEITTLQALTVLGSTHIPPLLGWLEADAPAVEEAREDRSETLQLAMLQEFLRTASDGWQLAVASARDLLAQEALAAEQAGGDFAAEAARLGESVAEVHQQLREAFPTSTVPAPAVASAMRDRLTAATAVVPELAEHADRIGRVFDAAAGLGEIEVQRIHGDLHLGQTMRTVDGWKLVDFEGEPAKPLNQRLLPDSRWRDVAGMIRSFDYLSHVVAELDEARGAGYIQHGAPLAEGAEDAEDAAATPDRGAMADDWAARNTDAFVTAYAAVRSPAEEVLVTAYVADKAVYECVYEARNRPDWLRIPLTAIARIGES